MSPVRMLGRILGAGALVALIPTPVWAHTPNSPPGDSGWTTGLALLVGLLFLAAVMWIVRGWPPAARGPLASPVDHMRGYYTRGLDRRAPRMAQEPSHRAVALVLIAWLVFWAGASAFHSVHHLRDARGGADCVFAQVVHHAPGVVANAVLIIDPLPDERARPDVRSARCPIRATAPSPSRGPPFVAPASTSV